MAASAPAAVGAEASHFLAAAVLGPPQHSSIPSHSRVHSHHAPCLTHRLHLPQKVFARATVQHVCCSRVHLLPLSRPPFRSARLTDD